MTYTDLNYKTKHINNLWLLCWNDEYHLNHKYDTAQIPSNIKRRVCFIHFEGSLFYQFYQINIFSLLLRIIETHIVILMQSC